MIRAQLSKLYVALICTLFCAALSGCGAAPESLAAQAQATPTAVSTVTPTPESEEIPVHTEPPAAVQKAEKADYLNYKFAYSITPDSQGDKLAQTAQGECAESFSAADGTTENIMQLAQEWIFDGTVPDENTCGAVFLTWSADLCELIDSGTFIRSTDLRQIYDHLTDVNGFAEYPLTEATQFGGSQCSVKAGDILFWMDDNGVAVNAGIVTELQGNSIVVAICNSKSSVAAFTIDTDFRNETVVKKATLVSMVYPCNEQLVFLFLVNEIGYTNAVACGAMANIYCESLFESNIEELDFSEGYGLCQWTGSRRAALEMWCAANSLDHSKLSNQLIYMKKELEENVVGDLDWYLRRMGNTEQDAVNAGVKWCQMFENPGDDLSKERGELAKQFYSAYSGHPFM